MNRYSEEALDRMDRATLQDAYERASQQLQDALLNGTPWEDVQDFRFDVTRIGIVLGRRIRAEGGPATSPLRPPAAPARKPGGRQGNGGR